MPRARDERVLNCEKDLVTCSYPDCVCSTETLSSLRPIEQYAEEVIQREISRRSRARADLAENLRYALSLILFAALGYVCAVYFAGR